MGATWETPVSLAAFKAARQYVSGPSSDGLEWLRFESQFAQLDHQGTLRYRRSAM